jgi:hypothetical protein
MLSACGGGGGNENDLDGDLGLAAKYVGTWKSDCLISPVSILLDSATQIYPADVIETIELKQISTNELRGSRRIDLY